MLRLKKSTLVFGVVLFIQLVVILVALSHPLVLTSSHRNKFEDYENYYGNVKAELEADISRQLIRIEETYEGLSPELAESFNRMSVGTSTDLGPRFDSGSQMFSTFNGLPLSIQFAAMISLISFIPTLTGIAALSKKRLVKGKINKILLIAMFAMTFVCIAVFAQMNAQVLLYSFGEIGLAAEVPTPHPGAPTYTIWTDGIYTYAVDASGNVTEWSSDTDASAVINNAISSTNGGKIFIKSGTYYISDNIGDNGKSNIELCGEGVDATILKFTSNRPMWAAGMLLEGTSSSHITNWYIHDLTIDGNRDNQGNDGHFGMYLRYLDDSVIERVIIKGIKSREGDTSAGKGIDAHNCNKILVKDYKWYGLLVEFGFGRSGYVCTESDGMIVVDSHFSGGADVLQFFDGTTNSIAANCIITGFKGNGANIYKNAFNNIMMNLRIIGNPSPRGLQGIYIQQYQYPHLPSKGNTIANCFINHVDVGIGIGQNASGNMIMGNIIYDDVDWGINVLGKRNMIANNILYGNTEALRVSENDVAATENVFSDNVLINPRTGIRIYEGDNNIFKDNIVQGTPIISVRIDDGDNNEFENCVFGSPSSYMIDIASGCDNNEFKYCDLTGYSGKMSDSGNTIYKYNKGYLTENSGTATGASPITVPHGLAGVPTVVVLGVKGTTVYSTSWTADETNIYIYHNAPDSITVTWYAES